jgi:RNA polymerase sigma-70 factor (ECF subfamily)
VSNPKRVLCTFWRGNQQERAYLDALTSLSTAVVPSEEEFALLREAIMASGPDARWLIRLS